MDRETARNFVAGYGLQSAPVPTPFWPDLDGFVSVRELSGQESFDYEKAEKNDLATGQLLVKTILLTESKSPIFNELDAQWLLKTVGISVLKPLFMKVLELSGMLKAQQPTAVDEAKKSSNPTPPNA